MLNERLATTTQAFSHIRHESPLPDLEYEIFSALLRADHCAGSKPPTLKIGYSKGMELPLKTFTSVLQARDYSCQVVGPALIRYLPHDLISDIQNMHTSFTDSFVPTGRCISTSIYEDFMKKHTEWEEAFAPLLAQYIASPERKDYLAALSLQLQTLSTKLLAQKLHRPHAVIESETAVQIVALAKRIISHERFPRRFGGFDTGIIFPIFVVLVVCDEKEVRREAMGVLRSVEKRESVFDSWVCVDTGEHLVALEDMDGK